MFRLILLILFVLVMLAFKYLDWRVLLIIGVTCIILSKFVAKRAILWLFSMPFRAKGKVLRGATVEVHSVRPAAVPTRGPESRRPLLADETDGTGAPSEIDDDLDDVAEAPEVPREYFEIDVTITPRTPTGSFVYWDFDDVALVKPGKRWDTDDDTCRVENVSLVREGTVLLKAGEEEEDDGGAKVIGPRRLRMLIGVTPGVRNLVFNYYFEQFGKVQLPESQSSYPKNFP